jgi:mannitol/fructose-specific phosphotransferase system IIA component (Ntr-type)
MKLLEDSLSLERIFPAMTTTESWHAVEALCGSLRDDPTVLNYAEMLEEFRERHDRDHLALGHGVWLPHLRTVEATNLLCAIGRWKKGVKFEWCPEPIYFVVLIVAPSGMVNDYLRLVGMMARVFGDETRFQALRACETAREIWDELVRE